MNAIATTPGNLNGILAALAAHAPDPATRSLANPAFLNLISLIFGSSATATPFPTKIAGLTDLLAPAFATNAPNQLAEALIRSMLGQNTKTAVASALEPTSPTAALMAAIGPVIGDKPGTRRKIETKTDVAPPLAAGMPLHAPAATQDTTATPTGVPAQDSSGLNLIMAVPQAQATPIPPHATPVLNGLPEGLVSLVTPPQPNVASGSPVQPGEIAFGMKLTPMASSLSAEPTAQQIQPPALPLAPVLMPLQNVNRAESAAPTKPATKAKDAAQPNSGQGHTSDKTEAPARVLAVSAAASTTDFARTFQTSTPDTPPLGANETKVQTPFESVAEALRMSEPAGIAIAAPRMTQVQEIALRIMQPDAPPVDLQVSERAGAIHVSVRTPEAALQGSLRQDLGTLSSSLERAGFRAETFVPHLGVSQAARSAQNSFRNDRDGQPGFSGRGNQGDAQQRRDQRQHHHQASKWIQEMENVT